MINKDSNREGIQHARIDGQCKQRDRNSKKAPKEMIEVKNTIQTVLQRVDKQQSLILWHREL